MRTNIVRIASLAVLCWSGLSLAQVLDKTFSIKNDTKSDITIVLTFQKHPQIEEVVKAKSKFTTKFNHNDKPILLVKNDTGDELSFAFNIPTEKNIFLTYYLSQFPKNIPAIKKDISGGSMAASNQEIAFLGAPEEASTPTATEETAPAEEAKPVAKQEAPSEAAPAEAPKAEAKKTPAEEKPAEVAPVKLSITPEQLLDVPESLKGEDREEFILGIEFKGAIKDATAPKGTTDNAIEKAQNAQVSVTKAYKIQTAIWKANNKKLPRKAVQILEEHKITNPAEQLALAAATLEFLKATYGEVKARFH